MKIDFELTCNQSSQVYTAPDLNTITQSRAKAGSFPQSSLVGSVKQASVNLPYKTRGVHISANISTY